MKQFIWMLCGIFLSGLLLGTLSACGADQFSTCVITTGRSPADTGTAQADPPTPDAAPETPDVPESGASVSAGEDQARMLAYGRALWDMYQLGLLPGGEELERLSEEEAAKNRFALADVNGDGAEELIVYWTNACMAGMRGLVYGYDGEGLRLELSEFPGLTFYGNGTVQAGWSHNQGWANRFWPFNLYQYSPERGVYEQIASVDAWDSSCTEGDEVLAAAFPREADADGDGLVYYIFNDEWGENSRVPPDGTLTGQLWGTDPVDRAALDDWLNAYTGGAEPLSIPFQDLNEENIAALGAPRPDVAYPEPLG